VTGRGSHYSLVPAVIRPFLSWVILRDRATNEEERERAYSN